jgi:uncharacterized protein YbaP (TraB family)
VDIHLRAEALRTGLPVTGLETSEDQIRMLASFPETGRLAFLRTTLATFDQASTELPQLSEAWAAGNIEGIAALSLEPMEARSPTVYETLIVERNRRWALQIARMLDQPGATFVAVGVLHLAGADSVRNLLSQAGFASVRIQ